MKAMSPNQLEQFTVTLTSGDPRDPLSSSDLEKYREYGCLLLRNFIREELRSRFCAEAGKLISLLLNEMGLDASASNITGFDRGLDLLLQTDRKRAGRLYDAMRKLPSVYELISSERVWALMRRLMGTTLPGIYPQGTGVRLDHPNEDEFLSPWHQEYPYNLTSNNAVTLWVPFVDANDMNGCLLGIPSSHRLGALPVRVHDSLNSNRNANRTLEINNLEKILASGEIMSLPAKAGDALAFHTYFLHRSQPNRSGKTRWTLQARYFDFTNPAAVRHDWVGGMNEGNDFRNYHPELEAAPYSPTAKPKIGV